MVEELFKRTFNVTTRIAFTEVKAPGVSRNKSETGKADIVLNLEGIREVYELKPGSHAPGAKYNKEGKEQLQGYIDGFNKKEPDSAEHGTTWNPNGMILPHPSAPKKVIVLRTYTSRRPYGWTDNPWHWRIKTSSHTIDFKREGSRRMIKALLDQYVYPKITQIGFEFESKPDAGSWMYCRVIEGGVKQCITFQKSNLINGLRFHLTSSSNPIVTVYANELISRYDEWWVFHNKETARLAIIELTNLFFEKGLEVLNLMTIPIFEPPHEISGALLKEPHLLAAEFLERFAVNDIIQLENTLLMRKGELGKEEIDWGFILGSSAFLGEYLRKTLGGVWEWDEIKETAVVINIGGKRGSVNNFV